MRALQARCSELTIIVPDMAKSAATIMCLGADHILMGPARDLGPVDPLFITCLAAGYVRRVEPDRRPVVALVQYLHVQLTAAPAERLRVDVLLAVPAPLVLRLWHWSSLARQPLDI